MKILFADYSTPDEHVAKEIRRYAPKGSRNLVWGNPEPSNPGPPNPGIYPEKKRGRWDLLLEQIINSVIVGGVAFFSALAADQETSWKTGAIAFGLTFFFELRKYRKL